MRLFAIFGAALSCVWWLAPETAPTRRSQPFDPAPLELLRETAPRFVLIGNSMLRSRINPVVLAAELGEPVGFLTQRGGFSAVWYLTLKNVVAPAGLSGGRVAIFFRHEFLTMPRFDPHQNPVIDTLATDDEPIFDAVLAGAGTRWQDRAISALGEIRDPTPWRAQFDRSVDEFVLARLPTDDGPIVAERWTHRLDELFDYDNLRPGRESLVGSGSDPDHEFEAAVEYSFLPHMLDLADTHGFQLWFIHVKPRPPERGPPSVDPELERYLAALRSYLESRGAGFIDLRDSERVTRDMYGLGDHIARRHRYEYTRMFPELAAPFFAMGSQP